jgi:hypothetical protein
VYALVQHEVVWASEAELTWTAADRAMTAAQEADTPAALAGAAWMFGASNVKLHAVSIAAAVEHGRARISRRARSLAQSIGLSG